MARSCRYMYVTLRFHVLKASTELYTPEDCKVLSIYVSYVKVSCFKIKSFFVVTCHRGTSPIAMRAKRTAKHSRTLEPGHKDNVESREFVTLTNSWQTITHFWFSIFVPHCSVVHVQNRTTLPQTLVADCYTLFQKQRFFYI
jgi:hypothetical protein